MRISPGKSRSRHLEWKLQTEDFRVAATARATDIAAYRSIFGLSVADSVAKVGSEAIIGV
jgi:hypothetical protein